MAHKAKKKSVGKKSGKLTAVQSSSEAVRAVGLEEGKPAAKPVPAGSQQPKDESKADAAKSVYSAGRFKIRRRQKHQRPLAVPRLPSAFRIFKKAIQLLWSNRKVFLGILGIYVLLTLLLVGGLSNSANIAQLKAAFGDPGGFNQFSLGIALFSVLVSTVGTAPTKAAGVYQTVILVVVSLALIWALRNTMSGRKFRVRDAFYQGMYPLVPVLLVTFVIGLQLLVMLLGAVLYAYVVESGIAVGALEFGFWILVFFGLSLVSLYMVTASIIAIYIAALPDMPPLKALRSARELVRWRRWTVLRKILFLPLALFVIAAVIMLPVILWITPLAPWLFFVLTILGVAVVHSYLYTLYRELLP